MNRLKLIGLTAVATISLFVIGTTEAVGQATGKWNVKASYSAYNWHGSGIGFKTYNNFRGEVNYTFTAYLEAGIYVGAAKLIGTNNRWNSPLYGVNANLHILPLFLDRELNVDPYVTVKFGGMVFNSKPKGAYTTGNQLEYMAGIGLAYYFWKGLGVFGEYSYGQWFTLSGISGDQVVNNLRFGVTYKF